MKIVQTATWLIAVGLAAGAGVSSYVIANEVKAPAAAHAIGFPPAGTVKANFAALSYAVRKSREPGALVNEVESASAREAYASEPLSSAALGLIIPALRVEERRNEVLALAGKLSRRNAMINEEQIKLAAARGDDAEFFRWLSRSVLTNNELRARYVGAMAEATAREGAVAALAPVVGTNPAWANYYWRQVLLRPASLPNAARLRRAIVAAPWRQTGIQETDQALVLALVNRSHFEAARDLAAGLRDAPSRQAPDILVNGDFARQPLLAPFDWQLAVSGTLGATIDEKQKLLTVSAIGGARGYAARQLVQLSPGHYRLMWALSSSAPIAPSALSARIYCAERGAPSDTPVSLPLTSGDGVASVNIPDGVCRWHWFSVSVNLPDGSPGVDAYFRKIFLVPATEGGSSAPNTKTERTSSSAPN